MRIYCIEKIRLIDFIFKIDESVLVNTRKINFVTTIKTVACGIFG